MWRLAAALVLAAASALYDDVEHVTKFTTSEDAEKAIFGDDANVYVVHFYQGPNDEGATDEHSPTITAAFAGAAKAQAACSFFSSFGAQRASFDGAPTGRGGASSTAARTARAQASTLAARPLP